MAQQQVESTFVRTLEFVILAITLGCSFWLTLLAAGIPAHIHAT